MELQGGWTKDEEGYMAFENSQLQRLYEAITEQYYGVYNQLVEELGDDEEAYEQALAEGYEMVTDTKTIQGQEEFATTFTTPSYVLEVWYEIDEETRKRVYDRGFLRIRKK